MTPTNTKSIFSKSSLPNLSMTFLLLLLMIGFSSNMAWGLATQGATSWRSQRVAHCLATGISLHQTNHLNSRNCKACLKSSANDDGSSKEEDFSFGDAAVTIPDLDWRVQKLRLEEENKKRFLRAKPRFLPYRDAMKWVQAWGQRWESKKDWQDWIMMGEKRNSYIPSRPDEYYTGTGDWISWDHFLGVNKEA